MKRPPRKPTNRQPRRGAAAIEFALIAPLMIAFTFGLVELGRIMLVKQTATHATREGARIAIRPTADNDDVMERVNEELALWDISGAKVEIEPPMIDDALPGTPVTVRVRVDIASVTWIPNYFNFEATDIVAESSMRRESTE